MEKPKMSLYELLLNFIFFIPVTLKISGAWLIKRAYGSENRDGWGRRIPVMLIALALSTLVGWQVADLLAFHYNLGTPSWILFFLLVGAFSYSHVCAAAYYFALRHIWNLWDKAWKAYERFWKAVLLPGIAKCVEVIKKAPGSTSLWGQLENEYGSSSKGIRFIEILLIVAIFAGASYTAYLSYIWIMSLGVSFVGLQAIAIVASLLFAIALVSLISPFFSSKAYQSVVIYSVAGSAALVKFVPVIAEQTIAVQVAAFATALLLGVAYGVPAVVIGLQGGFMKAVLKQWSKLLNSAYGREDDTDYQRFYQHFCNIILAVVLAWALYSISLSSGLALWLALVVGAVTLVYTYAEGFQKHFGKSQANAEIAVTAIALATYAAYEAAPMASSAGNFTATAATLVGSGLVAYPLFYIAFKAITSSFVTTLGYALESVHTKLSSKIVSAFAWLREQQKAAFNDKSDFAKMFGHLLNAAVLAAALAQALPVVSAQITSNFWVDAFIIAFVSINGFVLLGRLFSHYGGATMAFISSITTLAAVGYYVNTVSSSLVTAIVIGLFAANIVGGVLAPLVYLQLAKLFAPVTAKLAPIVIGAFEALWSVYKALWVAVGRQFKFILAFLQPVLAAVARTWQTITAQVGRVFGA